MGTCHWNNLDGQGKCAQHVLLLAGIGNADKSPCHGPHDFLPGKRSSTAFDHLQLAVDLIGAVHIDWYLVGHVKIEHTDPSLFQACRTGIRACHRAFDAAFDCCKFIDEIVRCGPGTDANNAIVRYMVDGGFRHGLLEFVLVHACQSLPHASIAFTRARYKHWSEVAWTGRPL